jgi:hypothetical protein
MLKEGSETEGFPNQCILLFYPNRFGIQVCSVLIQNKDSIQALVG